MLLLMVLIRALGRYNHPSIHPSIRSSGGVASS